MPEIVPLFSVPVFVDEILPLSEETKNKIRSLKYVAAYDGSNLSSTESRQVLELPEFEELKNRVQNKVNYFIREELKIKQETYFEIVNSWVLRLEKGQFCHPHSHNNSIISGCLYIDVDEQNSSNVTFYRPQHLNLFPGVEYRFDEYNIFNSSSWYFTPKDNMIMLWPSYLQHGVDVNQSEKTRYSLAFDLWHRGILDKHLYGQLKL